MDADLSCEFDDAPPAARLEVQLELLRRVTRHMATADDFGTVLQSIADALVEQAGATVAHIFLYMHDDECPGCRENGGIVRRPASGGERDLHLVAMGGAPLAPNGPIHRVPHSLDTPAARLIRTPVPAMQQDLLNNPEWAAGDPLMISVLRQMGVQGAICCPLIFQGERLGALGYLTRAPIDDTVFELLGVFADQAAMTIRSAYLFRELEGHKERLQIENAYLEDEIRSDANFTHIVGASPALDTVLRKVRQVAPVETTVLLTGETGTGKELVARAIHDASGRKERPLIKINCGAIPQGVVESELFGHERGAFTGALQQRIGRFELADKGTLFMDEVGELPPETQVKLLRVLQEQEFERVGGTRPIKVNVRVVAATNRDLEKEVASGRFRADLYYRLNVFPIRIPPLRERPADIPLLVQHFLAQLQRKLAKPLKGVSDESMERLKRYPWPGNIRELQNVLERAGVLATGPIVSLQEPLRSPTAPGPGAPTDPGIPTLEDGERAHIRRALSEASGKVHGPAGAAKLLGINASTLRSRMQKLGIDARNA
jgi:formate hydrogenlyase transcriptional activator